MSSRLQELMRVAAVCRSTLTGVSVRQWLTAVRSNAACYLTWPLSTRTSCKWMLVGVGHQYSQTAAESQEEDTDTNKDEMYSEDHGVSLSRMFGERYDRWKCSRRKVRLLPFVAAAAAFSWDEDKTINETEMLATAQDISLIRTKESGALSVDEQAQCLVGWERVMDRDNIKVYRRPVAGSAHLFEYKTFGTFPDIPARAFFNTQLDIEYRKQWDKLVVKLDVVDRDETTGTEVVHWITHFPYPMYQRDYVFLRRAMIDAGRRVMVIVSRYTEHPACPPSDAVVRVDSYMSNMVIKPHGTSFDDNGFDYVVTYYDDPKSSIPTVAYKWVASKGVPDFLEKVHTAAKTLHERRSAARQTEDGDQYPTDTIPM